MEKLFTTIKELPQLEAPKNLNKKIMHRLLMIKYRVYFYLLAIFSLGGLSFGSYHLYRSLLESETLTVISVIFQNFELSLDYSLNTFAALKEIMPLGESIALSLGLIWIIYLLVITKNYRQELLKI